MSKECLDVSKIGARGELEIMEGATLVGEIDIALDNEVDILWCVQLIVHH